MTGRAILTAILRDKTCPERMGIHEWFWQDTQPAWEKEGRPPGIDLFDYFDLDVREVQGSFFRTGGRPVDDEIIEDDGATVVKLNGWGARHREWKDKPGAPGHLSFELVNEAVWRAKFRDGLLGLDRRRFPDWDGLRRSYDALKTSGRFVVYHQMLLFEIMRRAMGDVVFLEAMILEPRWIHDFCDVMTTNILLHWDVMIREVGRPDGLWTYDDMGYTQAPFVSEAHYREFLLPYHKRIVGFAHDWGLPVVLHSCGRVRPLLPGIIEAGFDALHSIEAKAGQHLVEFAEAIAAAGRPMALVGNMDIRAFESNDRRTLEAEILPKLKAVRERRIPYIFFSDHSIPKSVHLRTYQTALELFRANSAY
jgi:uroporphyrinogen decarboxylase